MSSPHSSTASCPSLRVVHVISGLGQGGAEAVLYRLVTAPAQMHHHVVISLGGLDHYGAALQQAGIRVIALNMRGPLSIIKGCWQLVGLIRREHPDVIQTWMYHADLIGGLMARLAGKRAVVWGIRNSGAHFALTSRSSQWAAKLCARLSRRVPAAIAVCARQARHQHERWGYDASKFTTVHNGYDLKRWQPDPAIRQQVRQRWGVADDTPVVGSVARWNPLKDHANLLAAMAIVRQSFPAARLVLIGTGMQADNTDLARLLEAHGLRDKVVLLGPRDDVPDLMQALDVHVLSSKAEGFPNVVAEAMASGVANVVTDVGDAAAIVGEYGRVVPPQNAAALAQGIIDTLKQRSTTQAIEQSERARLRVLQRFSLETMVQNWERLWLDVSTQYSAPHGNRGHRPVRLLIIVNNPAFFLSHRLALALAAREHGYDVHIATMDGPAISEIVGHGFSHHVLKLSRSGKNPVHELASLVDIWRLFRRLQPDLVHAVTIKPVIYGGIAARLARVPAFVAAVSGLGYVFTRSPDRLDLLRLATIRLYRLALNHPHNRVILQNNDDLTTLKRLGVVTQEQAVLVRGSGVDLAEYRDAPEPVSPPCIAVCVARLLRDKGIDEFIEAAQLSRQAGADIVWQLVGAPDAGNPTSLEEAYVRQQHEAGIIEWLGEREDIAAIYQQAHVAVLPSYREGLPKSLIEAAACGRAIVTTDVPGCRDAIEPGLSGVLVPPRDAAALARAVGQLAKDDERRQAMGAAGRRLAQSRFDVKSIVAQQLAVYAELVSPVATPK